MRHVKLLSTAEWVSGIARPVAAIAAMPRDLCLSHGIEFEYDEEEGLGDVELAMLETHSGQQFGLIRYPQSPRNDFTVVLVDEKLGDATEVINEIMCDLELPSARMFWFDLKGYRFAPCRLMREDDHGNRVVVDHFDCYSDAFLQKEILEQRGHKQSYSIEMGEAKPQGWTGSWVPPA